MAECIVRIFTEMACIACRKRVLFETKFPNLQHCQLGTERKNRPNSQAFVGSRVIPGGACRWSGKQHLPLGCRAQCRHIAARRSQHWPCSIPLRRGEHGSPAGRAGTVCSSNLGWQGRHCRLLYLAYIGALFCLTPAIFWGSVLSPQSLGGSVGGEGKVARKNKTTTIFTLAQHRDQATFGTDLQNYLAASVEKWKIKWYLSLI